MWTSIEHAVVKNKTNIKTFMNTCLATSMLRIITWRLNDMKDPREHDVDISVPCEV